MDGTEVRRDRHVSLQGAHNFRDLGGYHTGGGRTVRWRRLFRSAALQHMSNADVELARGLGPEQFDRTARQQTFGELSVLQWLRSYYRHDRMHHAQILGEESDYQPRYATGQREPRQ